MTVYLVGAGPGDPGLLTVRGAEVLARADVVVYDRLSVEALLDLAPPRAERMVVKDAGTPQASIATDQYGNGMGGVRSPYVDVPNGTYSTHTPGQAICRNLGYKVSFDWPRLEAIYGSSKNYSAKVRQSIDQLLKDRWINPSDAKRMESDLIGAGK